MDQRFKAISYLHCDLKYTVNSVIFSKFNELTVKAGIPKSQQKPKIILSGQNLDNLLIQNELLIRTSRKLINEVFDCFTDKTTLIIVCDKKGYIVNIVSSPEILQWCFNKGIMLGTCLDYNSFGTNAVCLSLYYNRPVTIIGEEHYCEVLKNWNSMASPIRYKEQTIGVVNISSLSNNPGFVHFESLIFLLAKLIEERLVYNISQKIDKARFVGKLLTTSYLNFTIKEAEILYYLFIGKNNNEILNHIKISRNTLKTHLKNIYLKLGVNTHNDCIKETNMIINNDYCQYNNPIKDQTSGML